MSDQVVEVQRPAVPERLLIAGVDRGEFSVDRRERRLLELLRSQSLVLQPGNAPARPAGGQAPVLGTRPVQQLPQKGALIVGVVDHEILGIPEELRVAAQDAHTRGVKRAEPHAQVLTPEEQLGARLHFAGRLVGEREGENRALRYAAIAHEVGDPPGENPRLSAPGAREDQERTAGMLDRLALHGVEIHGSPSTRVLP